MAECSYHPARDAAGACVNCGKMVCTECRTVLGGKIYCQPCADEIFAKQEEPVKPASVEPAPVVPSRIGGAWWLLPILLTWLGGLITYLINKDRDPSGARYMLIWGIAFFFIWWAFFWFTNWIVDYVGLPSFPIPGIR